MNPDVIDNLIVHIEGGYINDGDIFLTHNDRELIIEALEFYKLNG